jgi:SagB-type dehydrogenase family enzyme
MPLSKTEINYPAIRAMHDASSLESEAEVKNWRRPPVDYLSSESQTPTLPESATALQRVAEDSIPGEELEAVIQRRGSTRQFSREAITFRQLSIMLDRAIRGIPTDFVFPEESFLNDVYLIVHAVNDLAPGAYIFHPRTHTLELLKAGDFRRQAGYLGLGQEIPADCSANVFFLTDLNRVLARWGNRGYRAAQLEASILGGKLYLAAYAQDLGASGLTFFDDDVVEFFAPHAAGKSVMFLLAVGKSVKRRR